MALVMVAPLQEEAGARGCGASAFEGASMAL